MKLRSLLPRRWRQAPAAAAAGALSLRTPARAWSLEALEPRVLLSADPVLGAVHLAVAPDAGGHTNALDQAYTAAAPTMHILSANVAAGPTVLHQSNGTYTDASGFATAALQIDGAVSVNINGTLGLGGDSTKFIAGNSSATTDTLTLAATGNIAIHAPVSTGNAGGDLLSALTITSAQNVTFDQDVTVNGSLTINATGIVTFSHGITIGSGGSLTIQGATQLVLSGPVALQQGGALSAGNVLLAADLMDFHLVPHQGITGTGAVTIRPAHLATAMSIFSPAGAPTGLDLGNDDDINAFAAGFSSFTFGYQTGGHAQNGAGAVQVGASTAPDSIVMQAPVTIYGGSIAVTDFSDGNAILRLGAGNRLTLDAVNDITVSNEIEAGHLTLTSAAGKIQQLDSNVDGRSGEALRALDLTASAATGVSLQSLEVNQLDVINSGQGALSLNENAARSTSLFPASTIDGTVSVLHLAQTGGTGANGISLTSHAGQVQTGPGQFEQHPGTITLAAAGSGISLATDGALSLTALGTNSDINLLAAITVHGGPVTLNAAGAFSADAHSPISASGASAISITTGTGALTLGAPVMTAGGSLTLNSGGALDLTGVSLDAGPGGAIALQSVGDLKVGIISAAASISLTSTGGAIVDALAGDAANLRGEAAAVSLTAANGIGTGAAPLHTAVGSLAGAVSGASGGIFIAEDTALSIAAGGLTTAGSGAIVVRNTGGDLNVAGPVHANGTGHILLESIAGNLALQSDVLAQGGSISLVAALALSDTGTEVRSRGASQTLDLRAGYGISLGASTLLATANAAQRLQAGSTVVLGSADAGSGTVAVSAGGAVSTAAPSASLAAGNLRLQAGGGIGNGAAPLQLQVARLAASGAGGLAFNELDDLSVGSVADVAVNVVGALGTASASTPGAALAGLGTSSGPVVLNAGGAVTLDNAVSATAVSGSQVRVSAGTSLAVNAAVSSAGGYVSLLAGGAITHAAAGGVSTLGGGIDEQAGGALAFAPATVVSTAGGGLRLQSGGVLTLGQLNAGSGEAWLQGTRLVGATGSGLDLVAGNARLIATGTGAGDGIGSSADALSVQVQRLALRSAGAAGVFVAEVNALAADSLTASAFTRVQADGTLAALPADAALAGLSSAAGLVLAAGGDLTVLAAVNAQATRLSSANDLGVQAAVVAGGALSLDAGRDLLLQAGLTGAAGLDLHASRDLLMSSGVSATAQGSSALQAGRDVRVGVVDVGPGKALYVNAGGSLRDADTPGDTAVNLKAGKLVLIATAGIGQAGNAVETTASYLGASTGGGIFIDETDALDINGALGIGFGTPQRVQADGSIATLAMTEVQGLGAGNAPLVLRLLGGALTVDAGVQSQGGTVRLDASGAVTLNAGVGSGGGALSLLAGGAVQQAAGGSIVSGGGAVDLQAGAAWTMAQGSRVASGGGTLRLVAAGALALAQLDAGSGAMSVTASQVKDLPGDPASPADLIAGSLMLRTTGTAATDGVGAGSDPVEIAVQHLAVATAGGGIFLAQAGDLAVDSLAGFTGTRVQLDGSTTSAGVADAPLAGLLSSAALVVTGSGALSLNAAASATGTVLLASAGDLTVGAALASTTASLSLNAGRDLLLNANVSSAGAASSLDLQAARDITQAQNTALQTANGVIALQAGRDITLETLNAGTAGAALIAGGGILDGDAPGDTETDITASALRLTAGGAIGSGANALETAVATLSASAASLSIAQTQSLTVDRVATSLQRVGADGSLQPLNLGAQEDLVTSGALLLTVNSGDLTLNGGTATPAASVNAGGMLLLRAVTGALAAKAGIAAGDATSLRAGGDLSFTASAAVTLAGAASLDAEAGGSIVMADGSVISSGSGALRLSAAVNLSVGAVQTSGDVSLLARNISDAGGAETDVTARSLRVVTTGTGTTQGFGTGAAPLQLQVGALAANVAGTGAGGFFAQASGGLRIDAVAVSTARVGADGSTTTLADAALSDLVSSGNVVLVSGGVVTLNDGSNADGLALQSGGNVLLSAAGDLTVGAGLRSSSGAISLLATGAIALNADVGITRTGRTLDVQAGGAVTMAATANLATVDSAIRVQAGGDLGVGGIAAGLGNVSLISTGGSIAATSGHVGTEVAASGLRLNAAVGVGRSDDRLDTAVQRVSARAAGGGIWLQEVDAVTITDVAVSVKRVSTLATTATSVDDATQSDLITTGGNGSIGLATTNGNISFADGSAPADGRSVTADGSGTVSLKAGGVNAVLNTPAGAITQQGPVTIDSGVKFDGSLSITGGQGGGRGDGPITISGPVDGSAGGPADQLVVTSDGADVTFGGAIGATQRLDGLTVNDARNISFAGDVKLAGDLTLQASGKVEFKGGLDLSSGNLNIVGATQLVIGNVVLTSGNAVIHVDALTLSGLVTSANAAATLELAGASSTSGVAVGAATGTGLALSAAQLAALQGFGAVQIGRGDQGATAVDVTALSGLATPHLTLAGASLNLTGGSTGPHAGVHLLDLQATQDLNLSGALALTGAGADVHATAGGALRMTGDGALSTQAGDVQLQAGGDLRVGRIDTRGTGSTPAAVVLASTAGTISEANSDAVTDVFADLLTLRGRGPALAAGLSEVPSALDVQANRLDVDAPSGIVLRDSGTGGRTAFNLLDGGQLYQELVASGAPARGASTAAAPGGVAAASVDAWAWLNAVRPLQESRDTALAAAFTAPSLSAPLPRAAEPAATPWGADLAVQMPGALAGWLGAALPAVAVAEAAEDPARFRVWSEELVL